MICHYDISKKKAHGKDAYKQMLATIESYIKTRSCGTCKVLLELDEEFRVCYECKYFFHVNCIKSKIVNKWSFKCSK